MKTLAITGTVFAVLSVAASAVSNTAYSGSIINYDFETKRYGPLACKYPTADGRDSPYFRANPSDNIVVKGTVCGQTVNDPCIIGMDLADTEPATTAPCGKCYLITLEQDAVVDDRCKGKICPPFKKTILTQVQTAKHAIVDDWIEGHKYRKFDISHLGWTQICHACLDGANKPMSTCASSPDDCHFSTANITVPTLQNVSWKRVVCGTTAPDGDDSYGEVGIFPVPPTTTGTIKETD